MRTKDRSAWLGELDALEEALSEFAAVYRNRPFDNEQGLRGVSAFALWYFVRQLRPQVILEVGVWRGFSTWLLEQAAPGAELHCFDPLMFFAPHLLREDRVGQTYRPPNAKTYAQEFSCMDIGVPEAARDRALVFFDDHQNKAARLLQARAFGFRHLIFDDNMPMPYTHETLEHVLADPGRKDALESLIDLYEPFPALWPVDFNYGTLEIREAGLGMPECPEFAEVHAERDWHSYVTYVRLAA